MQKLEHWKYFHCVTVTISHLAAFDAFCCELLLVALGTVDVMLFWDEALGADGVLASAAHKTLFVPLPGLVLHLLHAGLSLSKACIGEMLTRFTNLKNISAAIAASGELGVIAGAAVDTVSLDRDRVGYLVAFQ